MTNMAQEAVVNNASWAYAKSLLQRQIDMDIRWYKSCGPGAGRAIQSISLDFVVTGKSLTMTVACTMAQLSLDRKYKLSSKLI